MDGQDNPVLIIKRSQKNNNSLLASLIGCDKNFIVIEDPDVENPKSDYLKNIYLNGRSSPMNLILPTHSICPNYDPKLDRTDKESITKNKKFDKF